MGKVVLTEQQFGELNLCSHRFSHRLELFFELSLEEELFLQPHLHGCHKRAPTTGGSTEIGLQQALKGEQRFFVVDDRIEVSQGQTLAFQAVTHRMLRET